MKTQVEQLQVEQLMQKTHDQEVTLGEVSISPTQSQVPARINNLGDNKNKPVSNIETVEQWADLIGWRLFGFVSLALMFFQMSGELQTGLPSWALLALTGAGLGGKKLADVVVNVLVATGEAASTAKESKRDTKVLEKDKL